MALMRELKGFAGAFAVVIAGFALVFVALAIFFWLFKIDKGMGTPFLFLLCWFMGGLGSSILLLKWSLHPSKQKNAN